MTDVLRIKRRASGGAAGPPASLAASEMAFNEQDSTLYYGAGNTLGLATSIFAIAGPGMAASSNPIINGVAAPGVAGTWSRADHVHPVDTSRVAAAGGTLTGGVVSGGTITGSVSNTGNISGGTITGATIPTITGPTAFGTGGINFGGSIATTTVDLTHHVMLHTAGYGFNVTAGQINFVAANATVMQLIPGGLVLQGVPTAPTAAPGTNTTQIATTAFAAAAAAAAGVQSWNTRTGAVTLTNADVIAVLPGSSTTPIMDGVAAIGTLGTWAHADHVHPVDQSRVSDAGDTITGALTITAGGLNVTGLSNFNTQVNVNAPLIVGTNAASVNTVFNGPTSSTRQLLWQTAGVMRWGLVMQNVETGTSNVGADVGIQRYNDAGTFQDTPFSIIRASGNATFSQALTVTGNFTNVGNIVGGLTFGSVVGASSSDLSKHIALYSTTFGFGVTSARLNYVAPATSAHVFVNGTTDILNIGTSYINCLTDVQIGTNTLWLGGGLLTYMFNSGTASAGFASATFNLRATQGFGFTSTAGGQTIPAGMNGVYINGYNADMRIGRLYAVNNLGASAIQNLRISKVGTDQVIDTPTTWNVTTLSSATPAAGGTGWAVNDRAYDAYDNAYTILTVSAGVVLTLRMDSLNSQLGVAVPANPIALTACPFPVSTGAGLTVNLTWTPSARIVIGNSAGALLLNPANGTQITNGLGFGSATGASSSDLSKHIALFGTTYGFDVTSNRLNYVCPAVASQVFVFGTTDACSISSSVMTFSNIGLSCGSVFAANTTDLSQQIALYSTTYGINVLSNRLGHVAPAAASHVFTCGTTDVLSVGSTLITPSLPFASATMNGLLTIAGTVGATPGIAYTGANTVMSLGGHNISFGWTGVINVGVDATNVGAIAFLASPAFTGTPTAPTAATATNTTQLATTAFVQAVATATAGVVTWNTRAGAVTLSNADVVAVLPGSSTAPVMDGVATIGTLGTWAHADHVHPSDTSRLALIGGNLTGVVNTNSNINLTGTTNAITFNTTSQASIGYGGDGASPFLGDLTLGSWFGIAFASNISGQAVPQNANFAFFNTRSGAFQTSGDIYAGRCVANSQSNIQTVRFQISGTDQIIDCSNSVMIPSLTSATPVAGGTGFVAADRLADVYGNFYTATTVVAGAITVITLNTPVARIGTAPVNPIALTAMGASVGTGCTVNLTWAPQARLVLQHTAGNVLLSASGTMTITGTGGTSFTVNPTSVTPATADNSTALATTAFVKAQGYSTAPGTITGVTAGTNMTGGGTTGTVTLSLATAPALTGLTFGSTAVTGVNLASHIALFSTTYGINVISNTLQLVANGAASLQATSTGVTVPGTLAVTGAHTAPTVAVSDSSTNVATTAFVQSGRGATAVTLVVGSQTLTIAQTATDMITFGGTPASSPTVVFPTATAVRRSWNIVNNCGQVVVCQASGASGGFSMANGTRLSAWTDGTSTGLFLAEQPGNIIALSDNVWSCGSLGVRFTTVYATNATINTSDPREKRNMADAPSCIELVQRIKPSTFQWREDGPDERTHWGFDADNVHEVMQATGIDFGGYVAEEGVPKGLAVTEMVPILWKAVQELTAEVARLKGAR